MPGHNSAVFNLGRIALVLAVLVLLCAAVTARGDYDATFAYGGSYFSYESGDIDPALSFGHGMLPPGSGAGARFDFWIAPDGVDQYQGGAGLGVDSFAFKGVALNGSRDRALLTALQSSMAVYSRTTTRNPVTGTTWGSRTCFET